MYQFEVRPEGDTLADQAFRTAELMIRMAEAIKQTRVVPPNGQHYAAGLGSITVIKPV